MIDVDLLTADVIDLDTFILEILFVGNVKSEPGSGGGGKGIGCGGCSASSAAAGSVVTEEPGMEEPDRFGGGEEKGEDNAGSYHTGASAPNEVVSVGGEKEGYAGALHGGGRDPDGRASRAEEGEGAVDAPGAAAAPAAPHGFRASASPEPDHRRRSDGNITPFSDRLDGGISSQSALVDKRKREVALSTIPGEKIPLTRRRASSPEPAPERAASKKSENGNGKDKKDQKDVHSVQHQAVPAVCPRVSTGRSEEGGSNSGGRGEVGSNSRQSRAAIHAKEHKTPGRNFLKARFNKYTVSVTCQTDF